MRTRLDVLVSELQRHRGAHAEEVLKGSLTNEEYRYQCGVLRGLDLALTEAEALRSQEQDDDE